MSSCVTHSHFTCQKEQMIHCSGAPAAQCRCACQQGNRRIITIRQDLVPYDSLPKVINGYCQAIPHPRWAHCPSLCTYKMKLYFLGWLEMTNAKPVLKTWLFSSSTCFPALPRMKGKTCLLSVMEGKNATCSIWGSIHTSRLNINTEPLCLPAAGCSGNPPPASTTKAAEPPIPARWAPRQPPSPGTSPSSALLFASARQVRLFPLALAVLFG